MKKSDVTCPECSAGYRSDRANLKPGAEPANLDVHIIMVNYATHKTKSIRNWFAKRPRWNVHFTPTSASWINQVERFFALLTERALKRGVFRSVAELEKAIKAYIEATNADPKPFRHSPAASVRCQFTSSTSGILNALDQNASSGAQSRSQR
jgi:hypothetical protein